MYIYILFILYIYIGNIFVVLVYYYNYYYFLFKYILILNYIRICKWSKVIQDTQVLKCHRNKMTITCNDKNNVPSSPDDHYYYLTLSPLYNLYSYGLDAHRVPNRMSCHKAIVSINGRIHYLHDYIYLLYIYNR